MSSFLDLQLWRLVGAAAWHLALHGCLLTLTWIWRLGMGLPLFSFSSAASLIFLYGLHLAVLTAHRGLLSSSEVPPLQWTWLQGKLSPASIFLSRIIFRGSFVDFLSVAMLYGATFAASLAHMLILPSITALPAPTFRCSVTVAVTLSVVYCTTYLLRSQEVLAFPLLQRHRYFRVKGGILPALHLAMAYTLLVLAVYLLLIGLPSPWVALPAIVLCTSHCIASWQAGTMMLQIVFTEQVVMTAWGGPDPNTILREGLGHADSTIQDLAMLDLAGFAEDRGSRLCHARRAALFADEAGRTAWAPVGTAPDAPKAPPSSGTPVKLPSSIQWNKVSLSTTAASVGGGGRKARDLAVWTLRNKCNRASMAMRALSGLAAASRSEDRYGVVLLCEPTLADMTTVLLSTVLVLQQYIKYQTSSLSSEGSGLVNKVQRLMRYIGWSWAPRVDQTAYRLEDLARVCVYRVSTAFGDSLKQMTQKDAKLKPAFGSKAELDALLAGMLKYTE